MANRLRDLKVTKVDLVDEGANPDADIVFAKRKTGEASEQESLKTLGERLTKALASVFMPERVAKDDAKTYAQMGNCQKVIDQMYEMNWSMTGSLTSIMRDDELDDAQRLEMMQESLKEYTAALSVAIPVWAKGGVAMVAQQLIPITAELTKQRDALDMVIRKAKGEDDDPDDEEPGDEGKDDEDGADEPPVQKGKDDEDMNSIDVTKMTPEERATYEDFTKRYGISEAQSEPDIAEHPVVKGLVAQNQNLAQAVETLTNVLENGELDGLAKKYELLGQKPEELKPILKSMKAAGPEVFKHYTASLDAQLEAVEKGGLFGEIGNRGADMTGDAWGQIEAHAADIRKSRPELSHAEAVMEACNQHPELRVEYEKGRG